MCVQKLPICHMGVQTYFYANGFLTAHLSGSFGCACAELGPVWPYYPQWWGPDWKMSKLGLSFALIERKGYSACPREIRNRMSMSERRGRRRSRVKVFPSRLMNTTQVSPTPLPTFLFLRDQHLCFCMCICFSSFSYIYIYLLAFNIITRFIFWVNFV